MLEVGPLSIPSVVALLNYIAMKNSEVFHYFFFQRAYPFVYACSCESVIVHMCMGAWVFGCSSACVHGCMTHRC